MERRFYIFIGVELLAVGGLAVVDGEISPPDKVKSITLIPLI